MTRSRIVIFLGAALIVTSACHRAKPDPQAALDDAFKAGLLTKEEYDAKRADIAAVAAAVAAVKAAPAPANNTSPEAASPQPVETAHSTSPAAPPAQSAPNMTSASSAAKSAPKPPAPGEAPEEKTVQPTNEAPVTAEEKDPVPAPLKGCEDEEFKTGGAKSEARFYAASPEAVRQAAVSALESMDFNIRKNTAKEVEATKKRHIGVVVGAGGERVTLEFHKQERNGVAGTSVVGETRKSFMGRLAQRTWTDAVLAQMACKLRAGR